MKLYTLCPNTQRKVYLTLRAAHRSDLNFYITYVCPHDHQEHTISREDVRAEAELGAFAGGAVIGGLIGLLGGPLGAILGAGAGGVLGKNAENDENQRTDEFNRSH
ncbi:MAG: hypothetical protein FJ149_05555 [Euryarchaeota archaeon]|nr:hypothetical protein [Euryarchaeota archaeon]